MEERAGRAADHRVLARTGKDPGERGAQLGQKLLTESDALTFVPYWQWSISSGHVPTPGRVEVV